VVPLVRVLEHGEVRDDEDEAAAVHSSHVVVIEESVLAWRVACGPVLATLSRARMWAKVAQLSKASLVLTSSSCDECMDHQPRENATVTWVENATKVNTVPDQVYALHDPEDCMGE
jgi:hypothetical protein